MTRRVCLAIGVSDVIALSGQTSGFAYLDGATVAANYMGQWALKSGFGEANVQVVTDDLSAEARPHPVTAARVQTAVDALFPPGADEVEHLILHFCGHGLTDATINSMFWLFSDALTARYKINVDAFVKELWTFGVKRISLISDACRDGPPNLDLSRLEARRGVNGALTPVVSRRLDRLTACQDGSKAYMVGDPTAAEPGKCILSGVALDVLWGLEPAAFQNDVIDTSGFGAYARDRATERAQAYRLALHPECFVDPVAVPLVDRRAPIAAPEPAMSGWPAASQAVPMGWSLELERHRVDPSAAGGLMRFDRVNNDPVFRDFILGKNFGASHPGLDASSEFPGLPIEAREMVEDLITFRGLETSLPDDRLLGETVESLLRAIEGRAAGHAKTQAAERLSQQLRHLPPRPGLGRWNLVVVGGEVRRIWGRGYTDVWRDKGGNYFAIDLDDETHGAQTMVEFADGLFVPVFVYRGITAVVARDTDGASVVTYSERFDRSDATAPLIRRLATGDLGPNDIDWVAASIRRGKHGNPVAGAVAAYLYRSVSDFDNIRRMAFYYANRRQPIPFDIAWLGGLDIQLATEGRHRVLVPAVEARVEDEFNDDGLHSDLPMYVRGATEAAVGWLGGRCPWLTLGWDYPAGGRILSEGSVVRGRDEGIMAFLSGFDPAAETIAELDVFGTAVRGEGANGLARPSTFTGIWGDAGRRMVEHWQLRSGYPRSR